MRKSQLGMTPLIALVVLGLVLLLISAGAYYLLKTTGRYPSRQSESSFVGQPTEIPISNSDKTSVIERELESTDIGSLEADLGQLDEDASGL